MPKLADIQSFLVSNGLVTTMAGRVCENEIIGFAPDEQAKPGELAWLSPKQAAKHPERRLSFQGSLLLAPGATGAPANPNYLLATCPNPKLAFIRVIDQFFPEVTKVTLPGVEDSPISPDARLGRDVWLSKGVVIGAGVEIGDNVWIGANTVICNARIGSGTRIGCNCTIGLPGFGYEKDEAGRYWRFPHVGQVVIGQNVEIGSSVCIDRGALRETRISDGCKIDNLAQVSHNAVIGRNTIIAAGVVVAGSTIIGENAWIAPHAVLLNQIEVGSRAFVGIGAVVVRNVPPDAKVYTIPAVPLRDGSKNEKTTEI